MKRILFISAILFAVLALLSACGGENGNKGTYYLYENGKTDTEQWFKLDGGNWTADGDLSGRYELNGNKITFYSTVFGEEEEVWSGALKDGKLTIDFMGAMMTYYLDGKAPTGGNAGTNADLGTTTGGVQTTEQPKNTYHITYDANGGAFANGEKTLVVNEQENAVLTAPDSPTRENYTFAGWAKQKNGSEMWNFANDKATQNATLYATWKEKSASILSVDGATINGNSIFMLVDRDTESVSLSGKVVCSSDSVWKLYYDKLGQTEIPTKIAAGLLGELQDGDNVFYAVVTSNDGTQVNVYDLTVHRSYAVSVNYYNGSELLKTDTAYTGSTYAVSYRPTIKGYTFNKWKTSTGAEVKSSLEIWEGQSFYADKTANTYTVTYDVNGGDPLSQTTKTVTYDSSYTLSVPKRTGYSFTGWTLSGTQLTNANGKSVSAWNYDGNRTLRAAWSANTYQATLAKNISEAGTVTGEGEYTYGRSVTVSATTNNGYTWLGWYDKDDNQLSDNTSYTFTMGLDTTYTAKWMPTVYTITYNLNGGTLEQNSNPIEYTIQSDTITITGTPIRTGYTFTGWSISSIPKRSTGDKTVTANWTINTYLITYNLNGGTNAEGNPTSYTILTAEQGIALFDPIKEASSSVVLEYERLENGNYSVTHETTAYTFLGWYTESTYENKVTTVTYTGAAVELYAKWSENTTTFTTTRESAYLRDGDYVYFGEYPQTIKAANVTITETQDVRGYYLGSDGAYYAKVTALPLNSDYTFSTGATVTSGTVYYFKVEPIKWRILRETDGKALILCESIIANHKYSKYYPSAAIGGQTIIGNNYASSDIRAWLNDQFYNTAFTTLQQELIATTTVDNSYRSTVPDNNVKPWTFNGNSNACENTQDKIFLLSEQEVTFTPYEFDALYSNSDTARRKTTSDYSRATGTVMDTSTDYFGNGIWWLRSPSWSYEGYVYGIGPDGTNKFQCATSNESYGVVPAVQIQL